MNPVLGNKEIPLSSPTKVYWQDKKKCSGIFTVSKSNNRRIKKHSDIYTSMQGAWKYSLEVQVTILCSKGML